MLADIAPALHTFFVPQMRQLGLLETPVRCGALSRVDAEWGRGWLWVMSVGEGCLVSAHDLEVKRTVALSEHPDDFFCIGAMSRATAACTAACYPRCGKPAPCDERALLSENVLSFSQGAGRVDFDLLAGEHYTSSTITLTPRFFERMARARPRDLELLKEGIARTPPNAFPREVADALGCLSPRRANLPGAELYYTSKVMEAISLIMGNVTNQHRTRPAEPEEATRIACEAKSLIDRHLDEPLTLQAVADGIYVSRTRLCTAFKQATGSSVGAYLRQARMRRACELLAGTSLPVAEVSRAVGYTRQSSFAEAFKQEARITPTEWRRANRGK